METFADIFKSSLVVVGVFLGWLLGQLGERNKVAREDRRKIKRTIFYLLEVRHQLGIISKPEPVIDMFVTIFEQKFKHLLNDTDGQELQKQLRLAIRKLPDQNPFISIIDMENLNNKTDECIDALAEIDPTLAFRLNGKPNINEAVKVLYEQTQKVVAELSNDAKDLEELKNAFKVLQPNIVKDTIAELDFITLELARKLDRKTRKRIEERIKIFKAPPDPLEIETFVWNLTEDILKNFEAIFNQRV